MTTPSAQAPTPLDGVMRLAGWIMAAVGVGGYLFWAVDGGLVREGNWVGVDFRVYYQTAQALTRGENIYQAGISPPYVYPPLLAILVTPLTALPPTAAIILWKLFQHVCLLISGWILVRLVPARIRPLAAGMLLLGWLTHPLQEEIHVGESNSLILVLVAGALWLIARRGQGPGTRDQRLETRGEGRGTRGEGREDRGTEIEGARQAELELGPLAPRSTSLLPGFWSLAPGVLLALAVSIKVLPALFVGYLWWRGPRAVAAVATGGFLVVQFVSLLITPSTAQYWLVEFPGLFGQAFPFPDNQSINAFLARALLPTDPNLSPMQIASGEALRPVLTWLANLLVLLAAVWVLWIARRPSTYYAGPGRNVRWLLEVGLVLLTTHLVSGSTWPHHLIQLSVPLLGLLGAWWLAQEQQEGARTGRDTLLLALAVGISFAALLHSPAEWMFAITKLIPNSPAIALLASGVGLWVVLGLWGVVAATLVRQPKEELNRS
ncbi:MAG TPA: glycosyltransferase family 87 protein [Chloroflexia bacterium]|nr:glycosyltransferase family 87 protein [Chloroflexia bacterium]